LTLITTTTAAMAGKSIWREIQIVNKAGRNRGERNLVRIHYREEFVDSPSNSQRLT